MATDTRDPHLSDRLTKIHAHRLTQPAGDAILPETLSEAIDAVLEAEHRLRCLSAHLARLLAHHSGHD